MEISELYHIFLKYPYISTDSRNIQKNSIFFALKGDNFDGNEYANDALEKGAVYSIVDNQNVVKNEKCILFNNVLDTLQQLANYHRRQLDIPVIAVTGTNGKTTTKELLFTVLSSKFKTVATQGNLNNHFGVPITLLSIPLNCEISIIEMGANHAGEIDSLCKIANPNHGLITNIGMAHLEGFGSFNGVIQTKTELYRYIDNNNGILFYNSDNDLLNKEIDKIKCKKISYGTNKKASYTGKLDSSDPFLKCSINFNAKESYSVQTSLVGSYNLENVLAAFAVGSYFGVAIEDIAKIISTYQPSNNRSQLKYEKTNLILCDYYNANPSSMEVALNNFAKSNIQDKQKVIILGAMKELGSNSQEEHEKLVKVIDNYGFKDVYLVGNEFISCTAGFKYFENSENLFNYLSANKITNSYILLKGSRATKLEKVIESLKS
jgi:UDP-N-acetylmuramoyl-tripeptide--D-alanyl-D-alanine ligase